MTTAILWDNVVAYSLQIGLLVGLAAFVPAALRLQVPRARLLFWHLLLAACLLLPLVRPAQRTVANGKVEVTTTITAIATAPPAPKIRLSRSEAALLLLSLGALARLAWLGIGLWRLGRYRRHSIPLEPAPSWSAEADLRISDDVSSPVTFGFRHPVVLLPPQFPELDPAKQDAILCHEVLHVRRRDWLFTLAEELLRSVFWFHPAIWWLLGEIQLAREQAVDREVIEMTKSSDEYVDALLHMAGAHPRLDLAPAPLFLRKRHLKQRVVWILKEVRMSKTRWISTLAVAIGMLAGACWFVTGAFPLAAAPQTVADAPGVTVDTNGAALMHRPSVSYPPDALRNGIQGTVVLQVKLDAKGEVSDVSVLSGPDELRRSAIQSVLSWHFAKDAALGTRQVSINFQLPKQVNAAAATAAPETGVVGGVPGGVVGGVPGGVRGGVPGGVIGSVPAARQPVGSPMEGTLNRIVIAGLSDQARSDLLSRLPVREGEAFSQDVFQKVRETVRDFDDHLGVGIGRSDNGLQLMITAPGSTPYFGSSSTPSFAVPPGAIRVGGNQQQTKLVSQARPIYPPLAKQARIQGKVTLNALIGPDGHIQNLAVVQGHPLLVQAALEAVKDWVYEPTLLNGQPVTVMTTIDVNFTLSE